MNGGSICVLGETEVTRASKQFPNVFPGIVQSPLGLTVTRTGHLYVVDKDAALVQVLQAPTRPTADPAKAAPVPATVPSSSTATAGDAEAHQACGDKASTTSSRSRSSRARDVGSGSASDDAVGSTGSVPAARVARDRHTPAADPVAQTQRSQAVRSVAEGVSKGLAGTSAASTVASPASIAAPSTSRSHHRGGQSSVKSPVSIASTDDDLDATATPVLQDKALWQATTGTNGPKAASTLPVPTPTSAPAPTSVSSSSVRAPPRQPAVVPVAVYDDARLRRGSNMDCSDSEQEEHRQWVTTRPGRVLMTASSMIACTGPPAYAAVLPASTSPLQSDSEVDGDEGQRQSRSFRGCQSVASVSATVPAAVIVATPPSAPIEAPAVYVGRPQIDGKGLVKTVKAMVLSEFGHVDALDETSPIAGDLSALRTFDSDRSRVRERRGQSTAASGNDANSSWLGGRTGDGEDANGADDRRDRVEMREGDCQADDKTACEEEEEHEREEEEEHEEEEEVEEEDDDDDDDGVTVEVREPLCWLIRRSHCLRPPPPCFPGRTSTAAFMCHRTLSQECSQSLARCCRRSSDAHG